jgi:GNAT superfamily N-acetyltransferase
MSINTITIPTKEEVNIIDDKIIAFNLSKMSPVSEPLFSDIKFVIKDENNNLLAGIVGTKYYCNAAYIDVLWVDEANRGKGLGLQLLNKFEEAARDQNCFMIHLDTFDFQAPDFYIKNGYSLYGTLENNPVGHKRFYFCKTLGNK